MKGYPCFIGCLECRRATDASGKEWSIEIDLIEESYIQAVESRGIDAGHEVLEIFADVRVGRTKRAFGGGGWPSQSERDRGNWK